jgi:hypothetical protein
MSAGRSSRRKGRSVSSPSPDRRRRAGRRTPHARHASPTRAGAAARTACPALSSAMLVSRLGRRALTGPRLVAARCRHALPVRGCSNQAITFSRCTAQVAGRRRSSVVRPASPGRPRRPMSGWCATGRPRHRRKWARARHRSAHKLGPRRAKRRGRLKAPDICASLRQSLAPVNNIPPPPNPDKPRWRAAVRK